MKTVVRRFGLRALHRQTALVVIGASVLFTAGWLVLNADGRWGPPVLGWTGAVLAFAAVTMDILTMARNSPLPAAARAFWITNGIAGVFITVAVAVQAVIDDGSSTEPPMLTVALFVAGIVVQLVALVRLPAGVTSVAEWVRLSLDGATVMVAVGVFTWVFAFEPLFAARPGAAVLWGLLGAGVLLQVALAAVLKVLLAGVECIDRGSLRILSVGMLVGGLVASTTSFITAMSKIPPTQLVAGPLALTVALAVASQRRVATKQAGQRSARPRRPFSLLPYAAVVATDVLLIRAVSEPRGRAVVVGGAIAVTALVVVRQWGAFTDIARLLHTVRRHEERMRHQATHDALTQLANRTLFGERLDTALRDRRGAVPAVLLIDLDGFKSVNDTFGHAAGDGLLTTAASRLRSCVRATDLVARLGGDEFAVLLLDAGAGIATEVAERILAVLTEPVDLAGHRVTVSASIGVAIVEPNDDASTVLRHADIAMYSAKERGKAVFA